MSPPHSGLHVPAPQVLHTLQLWLQRRESGRQERQLMWKAADCTGGGGVGGVP